VRICTNAEAAGADGCGESGKNLVWGRWGGSERQTPPPQLPTGSINVNRAAPGSPAEMRTEMRTGSRDHSGVNRRTKGVVRSRSGAQTGDSGAGVTLKYRSRVETGNRNPAASVKPIRPEKDGERMRKCRATARLMSPTAIKSDRATPGLKRETIHVHDWLIQEHSRIPPQSRSRAKAGGM
jgi:hypothetical protein